MVLRTSSTPNFRCYLTANSGSQTRSKCRCKTTAASQLASQPASLLGCALAQDEPHEPAKLEASSRAHLASAQSSATFARSLDAVDDNSQSESRSAWPADWQAHQLNRRVEQRTQLLLLLLPPPQVRRADKLERQQKNGIQTSGKKLLLLLAKVVACARRLSPRLWALLLLLLLRVIYAATPNELGERARASLCARFVATQALLFIASLVCPTCSAQANQAPQRKSATSLCRRRLRPRLQKRRLCARDNANNCKCTLARVTFAAFPVRFNHTRGQKSRSSAAAATRQTLSNASQVSRAQLNGRASHKAHESRTRAHLHANSSLTRWSRTHARTRARTQTRCVLPSCGERDLRMRASDR